MFPWLIWLCMAGTAKGTVPSPLPSGDYIRLTGTSHFHRYYGAIRLPTTLLRPSFRCVHIPRFTRFHGRCRLSPVGIATVCSMNRSQTPPELPRTHLLYRSLPCCLPCTQTRRPLGIALSFRCSILSLLPFSLRFTLRVSPAGTRSISVAWLLPFRAGFPPACYVALCWAH